MELSITLIIIIITSLVSISAMNNQNMVNEMIFFPPSVNSGQWYRFFSCGLIHADLGHLGFNMLSLYLFGIGTATHATEGPAYSGVEYSFIYVFGDKGKLLYLGMYILALLASLLPTYFKNRHNNHYRSLGASGAVSAVIFAGILFDPLSGIGFFFLPVFIAGFIYAILFLVVSQWMERRGQDNINHSAHIFGALFGLAFTFFACRYIGGFNIFDYFMEVIKNASPKDFIQFGSN